MRTRISGWLAVGLVWLIAGNAWGQGEYYEVPPTVGWLPGPLGHPRYEDGGFFLAFEFLYWQQTNPLRNQVITLRGFIDDDGSVSGLPPGTLVGSGKTALQTNQVNGPLTFAPGLNLLGGWRFENGIVLQVGWTHLQDARYTAGASILPPNHHVGANLADTFLFSPVFNFPADFAGPAKRVPQGNPGALFGIWNGASSETLDFIQRFDQYDLTGRIPIWQTSTYRNYGLVGPRIVHIWERFKWRTVAADVNGASDSTDAASYVNIVSNNLYGVHIGGGHDWWLGGTPIGGFSASLDAEVGLFYNIAKERARYELGDRTIESSHNRNTSTLVPEANAKVSLWYYPWEAVQIRLGYDVMVFFNTIAERHPVDFNYGQISPYYNHYTNLFHGLSFGVGIVF